MRDAQGAEIYAWNAVLEQPVLKPGEKAWFKSRLASPPPEGRNIDVRFFNKRDIAAGGVSMTRKSGYRFSDKVMLQKELPARY